MGCECQKVARTTFQIVCLLATIGMVVYCALKYYENEDSSAISYYNFNERENDIHPTITLCISGKEIYDAVKLKASGIDQSVADFSELYSAFLNGKDNEKWDDKLASLNFDQITIDINGHVGDVELLDSGGFLILNFTGAKQPFYVSYRHAKAKCFSLDINANDFQDLNNASLYSVHVKLVNLLTAVTANIPRKGVLDIGLFLHYPKQMFKITELGKLLKSDVSSTSHLEKPEVCTTQTVSIKHIEVIRRRNTRKNPCNTDSQRYDDHVLQALTDTIGCTPPHWSVPNTTMPNCSTMYELELLRIPEPKFSDRFIFKNTLNNFPPPCDEIQFIAKDTANVCIIFLLHNLPYKVDR